MQEKLLNQDNIISTVARVALRTQKSEKSGNYFTILTLRFKNGLEIDYFVDKKDKFGLLDAVKSISHSEKTRQYPKWGLTAYVKFKLLIQTRKQKANKNI